MLNQEFSINGKRRDSIGLGMSSDKFIKFNLAESRISGVICSENHDSENKVTYRAYEAKCDDAPMRVN